MSRWQRWCASAAILAVIAGHGYCVMEQEYLWPFTPHPMYRSIQGPVFGTAVVMGVGPDGEFRLEPKHARPMTPSMLRAAAGRLSGKKKQQALETFRKLYARARGTSSKPEDYPELIGLRLYAHSWRIRSGAPNKNHPRARLQSHVFFPPKRLLEEVRQQSKQKGRAPLRTVPAGDLVLELMVPDGKGFPKLRRDQRAAQGNALVFGSDGKKSRRKPSRLPKTYVDYEFFAPKGTYYLWGRGTSDGGERADSVWLQLDGQVGTTRTLTPQGFGNFRSGLPKGGYAWSSAVPGAPPIRVEFKRDGKHRLRVSAREGKVYIDQLWLSRKQREIPLFVGGFEANTDAVLLGPSRTKQSGRAPPAVAKHGESGTGERAQGSSAKLANGRAAEPVKPVAAEELQPSETGGGTSNRDELIGGER